MHLIKSADSAPLMVTSIHTHASSVLGYASWLPHVLTEDLLRVFSSINRNSDDPAVDFEHSNDFESVEVWIYIEEPDGYELDLDEYKFPETHDVIIDTQRIADERVMITEEADPVDGELYEAPKSKPAIFYAWVRDLFHATDYMGEADGTFHRQIILLYEIGG